MGLELVEIVMEVEETFGVIVSDEAAPEDRDWPLVDGTSDLKTGVLYAGDFH